ncbi:MAG: hypothetical protein ACRDTG_10025 [Pseudonocardiaceae bacterium]
MNSVVKYGVQAVLAVVDTMLRNIGDGEAEEEAAVYGILTEHLARELELPEAAVFRAVVDLCAGPHAPTAGLPPVDHRIATGLRTSILQITVRYDAPRARPVTRTVRLHYGGDQRCVTAFQVQSEMSRDDLPSDVRERFLREGVHEATFQLYPRSI